MSVMPWQWLVAHAEEFGYLKEHCGPASVDLRLGEVKVYDKDLKEFSDNSYYKTEKEDFYKGFFYLCATVEYIKVPLTHCATINMRSSFARKGLGHKMAGFIDPGFEGQITLELETAVNLSIVRGERIVQLIYHTLSELTQKPYQGKYLHQLGATESYL